MVAIWKMNPVTKEQSFHTIGLKRELENESRLNENHSTLNTLRKAKWKNNNVNTVNNVTY